MRGAGEVVAGGDGRGSTEKNSPSRPKAVEQRFGRALWIDTLVDASIFRECVVNVGRRDSRARVAHLLCEFAIRLEAAGLCENRRYEMPMTQEQLADAVGLTSVHVKRVLRMLGEAGLISRDRRAITGSPRSTRAAMRALGVDSFTPR